MKTTNIPRIVSNVLEAAHKLATIRADKERLCYLVSDDEWRQLCGYISRFEYREHLHDEKVTNMHFQGIEVIKRSAVRTTP